MVNFICPINTPRKTSNYGLRIHPVTRVKQLHAGIDLVNITGGKVPVYSTASGTVRIVKTTLGGYGKYVIVTHDIKGVKYESVYAHLDSFNVSVGEKVYQGSQLGVMGNTGIGTGVHLHFEIHKGTYDYANGRYPTSIDPMKVMSLSNTKIKMVNKMQVSKKGLDLVKKWEGFYPNAYLCPANVWTIGWGTTVYPNGSKVKKGDVISKDEAEKLLEKQVNEHASGISIYVKSKLNQSQYDALASFHYNLGKHILKGSNLLTYLNKSDWKSATRVMLQYNRAGGKELKGLTNRRIEEVNLFNSNSEIKITKNEVDDLKFTSKTLKDKYTERHKSNATMKLLDELAVKHLGHTSKLKNGKLEDGDLNAIALELAVYLNGKIK